MISLRRATKSLSTSFFYVLLVVTVLSSAYLPQIAYAATCPEGLAHDDCSAILGDWPSWVPENGAVCDTGGGLANSNLPSNIKDKVTAIEPQYKQAAAATGVPWQLLAAVHYRESSFDTTKDLQAGNPIGGPYPNAASYPYGKPASFEQSLEFAARQLIALSTSTGVVKQPINVASPSAEALKDTLYSYNGRAGVYAQQAADLGFNKDTQPYEGSPYVMNNYDTIHQNMRIITRDFGSLDGTDTRYGAYTLYALLGGVTGGNGDSGVCGASQGAAAIVQFALKYAWPTYTPAPYLVMKEEYKAAIDKADAAGEFVGGGIHPGIDCGGFVTRVVRDSGADKSYNVYEGNIPFQLKYLNEHPEKWQNLGPQKDTVALQPGDIAVSPNHTYIFVGEQGGFEKNSASASYGGTGDGWRTPMSSGAYFNDYEGKPFVWYRLKG